MEGGGGGGAREMKSYGRRVNGLRTAAGHFRPSPSSSFDALSIVIFRLGLLKSSLICYSFCNNKSNTCWARYSAQTVQQTNKIRRVNVIWTMDFLSNLGALIEDILDGGISISLLLLLCEFGSFSPDFRLICTIRRDVDWNDPICLTDLPFALLLLLSCCH